MQKNLIDLFLVESDAVVLTRWAADYRRTSRTRLPRRFGEEALRESEERYRNLFDTMTEGFALHEIITDQFGRPCDYRFLDLNPATPTFPVERGCVA